MSLVEINENVKLAREYALLGNYSSAVVCYQGVLEQIKKYLYSVRDSSLQQKWQQVTVSPALHAVYDSVYLLFFTCCNRPLCVHVSHQGLAGDKWRDEASSGDHDNTWELPAGVDPIQTQQLWPREWHYACSCGAQVHVCVWFYSKLSWQSSDTHRSQKLFHIVVK